jgi:hypothetical protein
VRRPSWLVSDRDVSNSSDSTMCCWCRSKLGEEHEVECVRRKATVVVRMLIEYVIEVPESWDDDQIEFHRNDSSWCAGNAASELEKLFEYMEKRGDCPCMRVKYDYVREATEDDEDACGVFVAGVDRVLNEETAP